MQTKSILKACGFTVLGTVIGFSLAQPIKDLQSMLAPPPKHETASAAWQDFSALINKVGQRILEDDFPNQTSRDRAEGVRQLAHMIVEGLRWEFDNASPEFTGLFVTNTDTTGYGGPNVDNKYLRGRIDGQSTYILKGNVKHLHDIAIQTARGELTRGEVGTSNTLSLADLDVDDEGNFSLVISPKSHPGNWLKQGAEHQILSIRVYYLDWENTHMGQFYLVKEGSQGKAPAPLTEQEAAQRIANAGAWIESSVIGWDKWLKLALSSAENNQAMPPRSIGGGSTTLLYGGIPFVLAEDQTLVIEVDDPQADYFSFQTYNYGWFDAGDYANRQTSLNNKQVKVDPDGIVRMVVSARDPGVANWIDSEGRQRGVVTYRYMSAKNPSTPRVSLVNFAELGGYLPEGTPRISEAQRQQDIAVRQLHVQSRFHN